MSDKTTRAHVEHFSQDSPKADIERFLETAEERLGTSALVVTRQAMTHPEGAFRLSAYREDTVTREAMTRPEGAFRLSAYRKDTDVQRLRDGGDPDPTIDSAGGGELPAGANPADYTLTDARDYSADQKAAAAYHPEPASGARRSRERLKAAQKRLQEREEQIRRVPADYHPEPAPDGGTDTGIDRAAAGRELADAVEMTRTVYGATTTEAYMVLRSTRPQNAGEYARRYCTTPNPEQEHPDEN